MMKYNKACQKGKFEAELFDCSADYGICCYSTWCYPCARARAWAHVRGEKCSCCHYYSFEIYIKSNLRDVRGMPKDYFRDKRVSAFCPFCSLTQDIREIQFIEEEIQNLNPNQADVGKSPIDDSPLCQNNQIYSNLDQ